MREFIIATESNNDMPEAFLAENHILVIPHYYTVEEDVYGDERELTIREFYDEMRSGKKVGTMASNPAVILEKFTEVAKQGKDILFISFSSTLSCGYNNICMGAKEVMEEYPDMQIRVVDTLAASLGEGILIQEALRRKAQGEGILETAKAIEELAPHVSLLFTVENLDYLYRGGRLSKTSAVVGNMISLKPILYVVEDGSLTALTKVRGRKKSLATMLDEMEKRLGSYRDKQIFIGIIHGDCEEDALALKEMIEARFGCRDFVVAPIGPSIGAHTGPGTLGIAYLGETRS